MPAAAAQDNAVRINVGGDSYTDTAGNLWSADRGYNTGRRGGGSSNAAIRGTADDAIYLTQRWDPSGGSELEYQLALDNGDYNVKLLFAENWSGAFSVGARVFDVRAEGNRMLNDVDIYREAGGERTALEKTFPVTVDDGELNLRFVHQTQNPSVAGIEVSPVSSETNTANDGKLLGEYWTDIPGRELSQLDSDPGYPNSPNGTVLLDRFETPRNWADHYGTRVRGYVIPPATGDYRFWVAGDNEIELLLSSNQTSADARRIAHVPRWTYYRDWNKYSSQRSESIRLEAGKRYYVEARQKEHILGDSLSVAWSGPGMDRQIIAGEHLASWDGETAGNQAPATGNGTGLRGEYFSDVDLNQSVLVRKDAQVAFDWAEGSPAPAVPDNGYSVRWLGQLEPAHANGTQTYRVYVTSDDGVRLWLGDELLIDDWSNHPATEYSAEVALSAGQRKKLRLEYYESHAAASVRLEWSSDGVSREVIPTERLYATDSTDVERDSDGDGHGDQSDAFPSDSEEWSDYDGDGTGDNADSDDDGDGLSDQWETSNGLDARDSLDAQADNDGDGTSNLEEYQAGTDPGKAEPVMTSATVTWIAPTERTDGSGLAMSEIGGYRLKYGTQPGKYTEVIEIADAYTTEHTVSGLRAGETYHFVVTAYDVKDNEGPQSAAVDYLP